MKRLLGQIEQRVLAYTQLRGLQQLRRGELIKPLSLLPTQERDVLSRLARAGMIARVQRGLYLVPPRLPLGGRWSPDQASALNALIANCQGQYQICGPNAFNRYGFDDQVPTRVYAYNNRLSGDRKIGAVALTLIKVADNRLGDTEQVESATGQLAVYSSRVRTLVDAVYDWSRFAGLPRAFDWIRAELAAKRVTVAELVRTTLRSGNQATIRRIGLLLEREKLSGPAINRLQRALTPTTSLIPWIPTRPKRGKVNRRWGVVINE